jgi:hypothetical protein
MMRRFRPVWRRAFLAAVFAGATVVVAACGVPSSGKPILDGPATTNDSATGSAGFLQLPTPSGFPSNRLEAAPFIESGYLEAAAGQVGKPQQAAVTAFMVDSLKHAWSSSQTPSQPINVVRLKGATVTSAAKGQTTAFVVTEKILEVGVLDPQSGLLNPPPSSAPQTLSFTIALPPAGRGPALQPGNTMLLTDAPNGLYLNESALRQSRYYVPHIIYFWSADHALIPDVRYQSAGLSSVARATAIVKWVLAGPPPWMGMPQTTTGLLLADNTLPTIGDTFVVDLNPAARTLSPTDLADLTAQIRWSLGDIHAGDHDDSSIASAVQLKIGAQQVLLDKDSSYEVKNQANDRPTPPTAYAIDSGKVRPITATVRTVPELLAGSPNTHVVLAAVNEPQKLAAFVRSTTPGKQSLWIRRGATPTLSPLHGLPSSGFQRPVWLVQPVGALAVVANGQFYVINAKDQVLHVTVPNLGKIDAFSVAPDGSQVALVANGDLYTSLLATADQPTASAPPSLTPPRLISAKPALSMVTAVAWSGIDQLIVAGSGPGTAGATVIDMFADGTYINSNPQVATFGNVTISQLVAYPLSATDPDASSGGSRYVMMQIPYACVGRANCQLPHWIPTTPNESAPVSPFYPD